MTSSENVAPLIASSLQLQIVTSSLLHIAVDSRHHCFITASSLLHHCFITASSLLHIAVDSRHQQYPKSSVSKDMGGAGATFRV